MQLSREIVDGERIATLDIETTHYDASRGEVVAVGVGVHEHGASGTETTYDCFLRSSAGDEVELIRDATGALAEYGADHLVTYRGGDFDLPFLADRLRHDGVEDDAFPFGPEAHHDLYPDREQRAEALGEKWPSLEECAEAYGVTPAETRWDGAPVTNSRFGEELGPAYLEAVARGDAKRTEELRAVIDHYLRTDLENNFVVYYGDVGLDFDPVYAGEVASF